MRWEFIRLFKRVKENFGKAFSVLFDDIKSAANELFVQIPKDIRTFAKTLWAYKGVLWSDRDYDHAFILHLLQIKIRRTKKYIGTYKRHTRWKLDVKNMQKAEVLVPERSCVNWGHLRRPSTTRRATDGLKVSLNLLCQLKRRRRATFG